MWYQEVKPKKALYKYAKKASSSILNLEFSFSAGIFFVNISHVGAKSALLRRLFMPTAEKDVIRTLPCSSFPNWTHFVGLQFGVFLFRGLRIVRDGVFSFRINAISHSLRRSSFPNWTRCAGLQFGVLFFAKSAQLRFRHKPKAFAENCVRFLAPPSKSEALWLRICFLLSSGLRIVRDDDF